VQQTVSHESGSGNGREGNVKAVGGSVLAILVGAIAAGVLITAVEAVSSAIFPLPPGLDLHDHEAMRQHIDRLPIGAFLFVLAAWAIGTFGGAWVAARLANRARLVHGLIVGALFLLAGVLNMLMIPHPVWMWVGGILVLAVGSYLGARLAASGRARA
jgi:hypothetical protein